MTPKTAFLLVLLLPSGSALAQGLPDPMRPPARLLEAAPQEGAKTDSVAPVGLQAVLIHRGRKPAALINGEYVVQGQMIGEARLVKVGEDYATLKSPAGTETLYLVSGVERSPSKKEGKPRKTAAAEGAKR